MRNRRMALHLAACCALTLAATGMAPGAVSAEPRARTQVLLQTHPLSSL